MQQRDNPLSAWKDRRAHATAREALTPSEVPCNHSLLGDEVALHVREYQLMVHQANLSLLSGTHDMNDASV